METLTFTADSGVTDFYVLSEGSSLADWEETKRVPIEVATGSYAVEVDPAIATVWRLFRGATEPESWDDWLQVFHIQTVAVLPSQGENDRNYSAATITVTIDADVPITRTVLDGALNPITLPVCDFVLCDKNQKHIATLSPVITGSSYSVVIPRIYTKVERSIFFALRERNSSNTDLDSGTILFTYAATAPV